MRIYTKSGDLPFKTFTFPDGQPHFSLDLKEHENWEATIETAIRSPYDLILLLLAKDVLDMNGYITSLDIRYLLGGRMDRSIDHLQPNTLRVICRTLLGAGFRRIRVLDPHSQVSLKFLGAEKVLPRKAVEKVLSTYDVWGTQIIIPDKGATERVRSLIGERRWFSSQCEKVRDPATGALSWFKVLDGHNLLGRTCLILDDICDGGGTFVGLAKVLKEAGAKEVHLFVTHGIFSKGLPLKGIDKVYTTDSYGGNIIDAPGLVRLLVDMEKEGSEG